MKNLGQFLKHTALTHKDKIAFEIKRGFRTHRFSFHEVYSLSLKTAAFLKNNKIKKGDSVAIWSMNMPEYCILYFGCWLIGAIAVPLDVRTTKESLKTFIKKAQCKIGFKSKFIPGSFGKTIKKEFFLEDVVDLVQKQAMIKNLPHISENDLAEIVFTSGTTGAPKGVMLTHKNLLSDTTAAVKIFPLNNKYKFLSILPLSHVYEQIAGLLTPFHEGNTVTYLTRINRLTIFKTLQKNKITSIVLVPQILQLLMNGIEQEVKKLKKEKQWMRAHKIASHVPRIIKRKLFKKIHKKLGNNLQFFGCGSAPLNMKLAQKWENLGIDIYEGYGATETTAVLTLNTPKAKKLGSVGKVLPGAHIKINVENNEIMATGPSISPGYFKDREKTKKSFQKEWYTTGDVGFMDKKGFIYITGREAFRIILPSGQNVYPEDIEKKLNAHPLVIESCIVGVKREEGERVHGSVITKTPKKIDQIIKDINKKLASHEQILEWSVWKADDFPRTPFLKIDRKKVIQIINGAKGKVEKIEVETKDTLKALIAQTVKIKPEKIKDTSTLATDLKLDSLKRVELLSLIEEHYAVAIPETAITPQTTVKQIRKLIESSPPAEDGLPLTHVFYTSLLYKIRLCLQHCFLFPLHGFFVPMDVAGKENLKNIKTPAIFYFNHIGILDGVCAMRVIPKSIRNKMVIAVTAYLWKDYRRRWVELFGPGFPFDKRKKIKASLEQMGDFLDNNYSILMAPEGTFTQNGELLQFKQGIGFMAVEMEVPVVPIKIDPAYLEIFPPTGESFFENLPKKIKRIWLKIGKPLYFDKKISYEKATHIMQDAIEKL
ncbi:AMP-binding protein [Candidatus Margulisiibacteriota bacterium]